MDLVNFQRGEEPDHLGRWLRDFWAWDNDCLEAQHDYIQLMFPLREPSFFNARAATLDAQAAAAFRVDPVIQANLLRSLEVMLAFYGYRFQRDPTAVTAAGNFQERAPEWVFPNDHNHLRITRILKCLMLCGLEEEAKAFRAALRETVPEEGATRETQQFWDDAVR